MCTAKRCFMFVGKFSRKQKAGRGKHPLSQEQFEQAWHAARNTASLREYMTPLTPFLSFSALAVFLASASTAAEAVQPDPKVVESLEAIRAKHELPGMVGGVVVDDKLVAVGAVGVRKAGDEAKMTASDRVHSGRARKR